MRKMYTVLMLAFLAIIMSCSSDKEQLQNVIRNLEEGLYDSNYNIKSDTATQLVGLYSTYADKFSDDSLSAKFLFEAAKLSIRLNNYPQSINLFKKVYNNYPDFIGRPLALFNIGFYSDEMEDYENASFYYKKFIEEYPENEFADDAAMLLKRLGLSDEDFFNSLSNDNF